MILLLKVLDYAAALYLVLDFYGLNCRSGITKTIFGPTLFLNSSNNINDFVDDSQRVCCFNVSEDRISYAIIIEVASPKY